MLSPISFLLLSCLICHAAVKESLQTEKDAHKGKEDVSEKVTGLSFSDAVDNSDKVDSIVKEESTTVESGMESSTVKTTTVGYVEITEKAQEKHFQTG
jgi:hypothetical protein